MTKEELLEEALKYDIVTFDIFDTLITRMTLQPKVVFDLVEARANSLGFGKGFAKDRKKAEQQCYLKYGDKTNLTYIYNELTGYEAADLDNLKKIELEMELKVSLPRLEIQEILLALLKEGKKIILCSDMYLSSDFIKKLLIKCGYPTALDVWVSNEVGLGKHDGKMWQKFFAKFKNEKTLHIGDNEIADGTFVEYYGGVSYIIPNPFDTFVKSPYYAYLSAYAVSSVGASLIIGYVVNKVLFNSPFDNRPDVKDIGAIWMGPVLGAFMEWLVSKQDNSILLFVTREGYILQPLYKEFCKCLHIKSQQNKLFFASRTAVSAAMITSRKEIEGVLEHEFRGKLSQLLEGRFNIELPLVDKEIQEQIFYLPKQKQLVMKQLEPYLGQIIENGKRQHKAYLYYIAKIRDNTKLPLTIVDIGYSGTVQYYLSKIMKEKVSGRYLFLTHNAFPKKLDCPCEALCYTIRDSQPVFENLLFLEGILQVPYGQMRGLELINDKIVFDFKDDIIDEPLLQEAQLGFVEFIKEFAEWKVYLGKKNFFDIASAQVLWLCLIKFGAIPEELINCFRLQDNFAGNSLWHYEHTKQEWRSEHNVFPLVFSLVPGKTSLNMKARLKLFCKQRVPASFYEVARSIWIKYLK